MVVVLAGLLLAALLNSRAMVSATDNLSPGWRRTTVRAVAVPLDVAGRALRLDRPRAALDEALGRGEDGSGRQDHGPHRARAAEGWQREAWRLGPPVRRSVARPRQVGAAAARLGVGRTRTRARARGGAPAAGERGEALADADRRRLDGGALRQTLVNSIDDDGKVKARIDVKYGTGLVRLDAFDWLAHARDLASTPADLTVVMIGGNDAQDISGSGRRLVVASAKWQAEYARRARQVMTTLTADGRRVIWVGMPLPRSAKLQRAFESLNSAVRTAATGNPLVTYVDVWADYAPDGKYVDYMDDGSGRQVKVRNRDGVHLAKAGATMLARKLRVLLVKEWALD
jgi:lysophospholipase L1-like esterase